MVIFLFHNHKKQAVSVLVLILLMFFSYFIYSHIVSAFVQEASTSGQSFTLNVFKTGSGFGTISSSPLGIDCGNDCNNVYNSGTNVILTAIPSSDSTFNGWSGDCSGAESCALTMDSIKSVTATFTIFTPSPPGSGGGGWGGFLNMVTPLPKSDLPTGDFNKDGFINYRDLSILLYWFGKTGPDIVHYDLNGDKKIDFVDLSILLYRWKDV